jgi:SOS-response transcriptional repressor LexA
LALLTGLKQPNLSRIENGLVSPRPATLEKIAKALGVEASVFYSESKVQEVERKWAASLGPKHAAMLYAGKLAAVPLLDTSLSYPLQIDAEGEPQAHVEALLQLPAFEGEVGRCFALRMRDNSMQTAHKNGFEHRDVLVFSDAPAVKDGDYAFVMLRDGSVIRKVFLPAPDSVRLAPLNSNYQERLLPIAEVRRMWRLVRQLRSF